MFSFFDGPRPQEENGEIGMVSWLVLAFKGFWLEEVSFISFNSFPGSFVSYGLVDFVPFVVISSFILKGIIWGSDV